MNESIKINEPRLEIGLKNEPGTYFCKNTKPIAILIESCFIDNFEDFSIMISNIERLAEQIVYGLDLFNLMSQFLDHI